MSYCFSVLNSLKEKERSVFVRSKSLPREKTSKSDPAAKRSGVMLVPGKRFEMNKKSAILLFREKLHFVFNLKESLLK